MIAWLLATALCWLLKGFFRRPRPASVLCTAVGAHGEQHGTIHASAKAAARAEDSAPPSAPIWAHAAFERRRARWPRVLEPHLTLPNAAHSFPSFDAACAASFAGVVACYLHYGRGSAATARGGGGGANAAYLSLLVALVAYGRVFFFAHHLLDVLAGVCLGFVLPTTVAALAPPDAHPWVLLWLAVCLIALCAFFSARRLPTFLAGACMIMLACHAPPAATLCGPTIVGGIASAVGIVFRSQALGVKPAVLAAIEDEWRRQDARSSPARAALSPSLAAAVRRKRESFRSEAAAAGVFPGNVHLLGAFYHLPFMGDWEELERLLANRLEDWAAAHAVDLRTIDLVLGVLSGGTHTRLEDMAQEACAHNRPHETRACTERSHSHRTRTDRRLPRPDRVADPQRQQPRRQRGRARRACRRDDPRVALFGRRVQHGLDRTGDGPTAAGRPPL